MTFARIVSIVGFKDSGKTQLVESLVKEFHKRGYASGTLKHTAEDEPFDTPGKDTWRHRKAGAEATAILHSKSAAFFIDRYIPLYDAIERLGKVDYVILEGFKSIEASARIALIREEIEVDKLLNGLEIAIINNTRKKLPIPEKIPVYSSKETQKLVDIIEKKAFPMLPLLNCGGCGYRNCKAFAKALLNNETKIEKCVGYSPSFNLKVNDKPVNLGPFVQNVFRNTIIGFVKSLKGVEPPSRVEIYFQNKNKIEDV
jgi:molybdopterin-guanine dinucleotide biosynthesis protein B